MKMRLQWLVVLFNERTETHLNVSTYSPDTGRMKPEPDQINTARLSTETMRNIPQKVMLGWGGRDFDAPRNAYVIDSSVYSALVGFADKHSITHSFKTNGCLERERQGYRKFKNETTGTTQPTPLGQKSRWKFQLELTSFVVRVELTG